MPYSGPNDPKLPSHVKKMGGKERERWVGAWNGAHKSCMAKGDGDCEGYAFRVANAAAKKSMEEGNIPIDEEMVKCLSEGPEAMMYYRPYGGATSFADIDAWVEASEKNIHMSEVLSQFRAIMDNIMDDNEIEDKAGAMKGVVDELGERMTSTSVERGGFIKSIKEIFGLGVHTNIKDTHTKDMEGVLQAAKQLNLDGEGGEGGLGFYKSRAEGLRFVSVVSNNYQDRQKEYISEEAHKEYIEYVEKSGDYPVALLWHTPGTRWGKVDTIAIADGFLVESGKVDAGKEHVATKLAAKGKAIGHSHLFRIKSRDPVNSNIITQYRQSEMSALPVSAAANLLTNVFSVVEEGGKEMEGGKGFSPEKREFLVEMLGEEGVREVEGGIKTLKDIAEEFNLSRKSQEEHQNETTETPEDQPPEGAVGAGVKSVREEVIEVLKELLPPIMKEVMKPIEDFTKEIEEVRKAHIPPATDLLSILHSSRPSSSDSNIVGKDHALAESEPHMKGIDDLVANITVPRSN